MQCEPCGTTVACDVPWRTIIDHVHKSCSEMISECSYNDFVFPCCEYFRAVDSEHGPCYSFNTLQHNGQNSVFVVNMTTGPGVLMFRLLSNAELSIHSPEELSTNNLDGKLKHVIHTYSENRAGLLFSVVEIVNDVQLQRESIEDRGCRYLHEVPGGMIHTYPVYSYGACRLAETTKEFYEHCGCVHPARDRTYEKIYCNYTGINCWNAYEAHKAKIGVDKNARDDCVPSCVESELKTLHYSKRWVKDQPGVGTLVEVKMASIPTLRYQRNLLRDNLDLVGGGLLVDMMKRALQNKQYAEIDHAIKTKVEPFLYNKGRGRYIPVSHLVLLRNKERSRHKLLPPLRSMETPDDEFDVEKDWPLVTQEEYNANPSGYRELCWDLKERGAVGETILHLCLLNASSLLANLAKRLLRFYPKLINDVYMGDEYYGESVLHITIVNEDPTMVKFLLDAGANYHERCYGNFMCPEDQKASRNDSFDHEWVNVQPETNYSGYVYWGEYPLSFAACLGQEECYRLILARGADPDKQDTNGNTVLHMLVIYEKMETFDMAFEVGASLNIKNVLNLTPLTLAAKLARTDMFFHILNIEREIYWQIGATTCAAYPLGQVDTIDTETGCICKDSALNLVVFGEKDEHLGLLEGMLIDLLKTKWNTFVKFRFYRQFILFTCYFLISLVCFTLRPGPPDRALNSTALNATVGPVNDTDLVIEVENCTIPLNGSEFDSGAVEIINGSKPDGPQCARFKSHGKDKDKDKRPRESDMEGWWEDLTEDCRLMNFESWQAKVRISAELLLWVGALAYVGAALREARFLGIKMFIENLSTVPSRVMFLLSCILMLVLPTLRLWCADEEEDHLAVIIMLTTAPYFLFFCRGFKTVGPFVVMIYRMVMGDLLRFVCIYLVFVMGFSQAYYIIFLSFDNPNTPEGVDDSVSNPMPSPMESIMAMFLMSLTSFSDYYGAFDRTDHEIEAKLLFVVYMIIVAILLVNMLIAMMGNTYQKIAETRNEWQRQWARIVLVVERGVPPAQRLKNLLAYSQPMANGKRALVLRINQKDEDKEEMKEILEMKRTHEKIVAKRKLREEHLASGKGHVLPPTPPRDYPIRK